MAQGWWKSQSRETEEEMELRIARTVSWIRRIACANICDVLILVSHEGFSCACIRRFLKCDDLGLINWLYNASFSCLTLIPNRNSHNPTSADGEIDECHQVNIFLNYLNSVEHLPLEALT
jgi:hypothetical protein